MSSLYLFSHPTQPYSPNSNKGWSAKIALTQFRTLVCSMRSGWHTNVPSRTWKHFILHFIFEWLFTQKLKFQEGQMLKAPPLKSSDLHFLVFQDRSEGRAINKMFEKVFMMTTSPPSCHTLSQKCKPPPPSPWVVWMSSSILYLDGLKLRYQPVKCIVLSFQKMDLELPGFFFFFF